MTMKAPAAYGIYPHEVAVRQVTSILNQAGFKNEDICIVLSPTHPISTIVRDGSILDDDREVTAVNAGLIGWLSEFGAVVIPTVGFFIRSKAFLHALVGDRDSSQLCVNSGTLAALGLPEDDAQRLEDQVRKVGALVYVSCSQNAKASWAIELLQRAGAIEALTLGSEAAAATTAA